MLAALAGILAGPIFGLSVDSVLDFVIAGSAVVVRRPVPLAADRHDRRPGPRRPLGAVRRATATTSPGFKTILNAVPGSSASVIYVALLVALLIRGRETRPRGRCHHRSPSPCPPIICPTYRDGDRRGRGSRSCAAMLLWGTDAIPWTHVQAGGLEQMLIIQALGLSVVFLSFNVVVGQLGVASMAQAAMVTSGALMAGIIAGHHFLGGNFIVCMLAAGISGRHHRRGHRPARVPTWRARARRWRHSPWASSPTRLSSK